MKKVDSSPIPLTKRDEGNCDNDCIAIHYDEKTDQLDVVIQTNSQFPGDNNVRLIWFRKTLLGSKWERIRSVDMDWYKSDCIDIAYDPTSAIWYRMIEGECLNLNLLETKPTIPSYEECNLGEQTKLLIPGQGMIWFHKHMVYFQGFSDSKKSTVLIFQQKWWRPHSCMLVNDEFDTKWVIFVTNNIWAIPLSDLLDSKISSKEKKLIIVGTGVARSRPEFSIFAKQFPLVCFLVFN